MSFTCVKKKHHKIVTGGLYSNGVRSKNVLHLGFRRHVKPFAIISTGHQHFIIKNEKTKQ